MWDQGIGLLGISGKYREITEKEQVEIIDKIIERFSFIDTASVYGEDKRINPVFANRLSEYSKEIPIVINKIGADLMDDMSLDPLVDEYERERETFSSCPFSVLLLHRPSLELLERDFAFYNYLRGKSSSLFGLCTNNLSVLKVYSEKIRIDVLQIAINLLDYKSNEEILKFAKEKGITVHARSVLSSGLLSGKYKVDSEIQFTDAMRSRFCASSRSREILNARLENVALVKEFYESLDIKDLSFPQFVHCVTRQSPFIDGVVLGGSSLEQILENANIPDIKFSDDMLEEIYTYRITEWASPYL